MTSPARRQYLDIKAQHQDALLAYQVGDFFEFFDEDARIAARDLQIVLTGRSYGTDEHVPLAGVPVHAAETYLPRLVARGHRVAICEQVAPAGRGLAGRVRPARGARRRPDGLPHGLRRREAAAG